MEKIEITKDELFGQSKFKKIANDKKKQLIQQKTVEKRIVMNIEENMTGNYIRVEDQMNHYEPCVTFE